MKRFTIRLLLFYAVNIVLLICLELIVRKAPNPYKAKSEYMACCADSIEILVFGSSHNYYGIRPELFSRRAYSLANISQDIYYDYVLLNRYVDDCPNLKYVICNISTFSPIYERLEDGIEWYRVIGYELYMGIENHSCLSRYKYEISYPRAVLAKLRPGLKELFRSSCLDSLYKGGVDNGYSISNRSKDWNDAKATLKRNVLPFDKAKFDEALKYCSLIAQICRSRDIKLVFVTTPTTPSYYSAVPVETRRLMHRMYAKSAEVWDKTYYIDLLDDQRFGDDDFYDADHLNREYGAPKFTKIINDTIRALE